MKFFSLSKRQKLHIFPISDLHIGSNNFNEEYFLYALEKFDSIKGPKIIYLLGDLLESASLSVGNSSFKQELSLNEQINQVIDYLSPYKRFIRGSCPGNHEMRLKKDYDLDISKLISDNLGVGYGAYVFDELLINNKPFEVFATHGKGSSRYLHTSIAKVERELGHFNSDLYLYGHLHRSCAWNNTVNTIDGLRRKYYVLSGHYLGYDGSYAVDMALPELPESFSKIKVGSNLSVDVSHFNIDIEKPELIKKGL